MIKFYVLLYSNWSTSKTLDKNKYLVWYRNAFSTSPGNLNLVLQDFKFLSCLSRIFGSKLDFFICSHSSELWAFVAIPPIFIVEHIV